MSLSSAEETAVQDTWALVAKDLRGNGVQFFIHFFKGYPEYQKVFRGFADIPLEELADNKRLKAHACTVMNAINGFVDNLDDLEVLTELLIKTGSNHKKRQLKVGDFQNLKESLLEFFAKALGDAWNPVAENAFIQEIQKNLPITLNAMGGMTEVTRFKGGLRRCMMHEESY